MAQQYDTTVGDVVSSVQSAYSAELAAAVAALLGESDDPVDAQQITDADEIDDSTADVLFIDLDSQDELQFNDEDRTDGRVYVFEGGDGYTATFNSVERVIIGSNGDDDFTVNGDENTTISGGLGDDVLMTSGGDDSVDGGMGSDTIDGGMGSDTIEGGAGVDFVEYSGSSDGYTIEQNGAVVTVTDGDGNMDTLVGVELLRFDDELQLVDYDEDLETLATLYEQVLGRDPDLDGFQFWATALEADVISTGQLAVEFITSEEAEFGGDLDTVEGVTEAVEGLYQQLLGRESDESGEDFWVDAIVEGNSSLEEVAQGFVDSVEFQGMTINPSEWDFMI